MDRRVAVTGLGVITPIGNNVEEYWKNLLEGVCGIDFIKSFPIDELPAKVAAEVKDFNPADYGIEPPFARKQDKFTIYAVAAAWQAMRQSGLNASEDGNRIFHGRFFYHNRLETSLQSCILFNILPIFVQCSRTDTMQFTTRQHGL